MTATHTIPPRRRSTSHALIAGTMDEPLLTFNLEYEIAQLQSDKAFSGNAGRSSITLVKHRDLRVVLIAMKSGNKIHEHKAAARISLQTLEGRIRVCVGDRAVELARGHLLTLDQCLAHDVEALEDSAFLLTLSWPAQHEVEECKTHARKKVRHVH